MVQVTQSDCQNHRALPSPLPSPIRWERENNRTVELRMKLHLTSTLVG